MRRGCVQMIVLLSVIVLLISVAFYVFRWPTVQREGTSSFAYVIEEALEKYREDQQSYPPDSANAAVVKALYENNPRKKKYIQGMESIIRDGQFTDFWKNPLRVEFPSAGDEGKARVISAGPNGEFGDEDDITSQIARDRQASEEAEKKAG